MKTSKVVILILAIIGALIAVNSVSIYTTNQLGLVIGVLLMLPGIYMAVRELWTL